MKSKREDEFDVEEEDNSSFDDFDEIVETLGLDD